MTQMMIKSFGDTPYKTTGKRIDAAAGNYYQQTWGLVGGDSAIITVLMWVRFPSAGVLSGSLLSGAWPGFNHQCQGWDNSPSSNHMRVFWRNPAATIYYDSTSGDYASHGIATGDWFPWAQSYNGATNKATHWMGENKMSIGSPNWGALDTSGVNPVRVGADQVGANPVAFDVSEVYISDEYVDFDDEATRRKFWDTDIKPVYLGETGEIPTGAWPERYYPNGDWSDNKGRYGSGTIPFSETGTVSNSSTSPSD